MNCFRCERQIPEESRYCMYCGVYLSREESAENTDEEWQDRILCSDGRCTGVIEKGVCTQCGLPG